MIKFLVSCILSCNAETRVKNDIEKIKKQARDSCQNILQWNKSSELIAGGYRDRFAALINCTMEMQMHI